MRFPGRGSGESLARMRALAHPLRLRLLEEFAAGPCTTLQAAERMGEPPTRLYHHVHLLQRAGLIRLSHTRPNRGTTEKYFELVTRERPRGTRARLAGPAPVRRARLALAATVLDETRREMIERLSSPPARGARARAEENALLLARVLVGGTDAQVAELRARIMTAIEEHAEACRRTRDAAGPTGRSEPRWALTLALLPRVRGATKRARRR